MIIRWIVLSSMVILAGCNREILVEEYVRGGASFQEARFEELTERRRQLVLEAAKAMETAYNPYSRFYVGAALLTDDGEIISASNVENAAYGSTICAERLALGRANAVGKRKFQAIAIIGRGEDFESKQVVTPCGSCRQMLYEAAQVSGTDMEVIMSNTKKGHIVIATIGQLLPMAFGPKDLNIDLEKYRK